MVVHASSCIYMYLYDQNTNLQLFEMNLVSLKLSIYINLYLIWEHWSIRYYVTKKN
jgi:hypothetical protein